MRILMATGGSEQSDLALRFGAQIACRVGEVPAIMTVIRHEADRARAEAILARVSRLLKPVLPQVETIIRVGHPAEEIIREAEEGDYHLLLVGERQRRGPVTRFLLGSTALRVVEHAPCPVIIAKGKISDIRRILLCDSGAAPPAPLSVPPKGGEAGGWGIKGGSLVSRFAAQLADLIQGDEEATILHVMSQISAGPGIRGAQLRADAQELIQVRAPEGELLQQDAQILEELDLHAVPKVRHGLVVDEILAEAQGGDYGLVVIGAHHGEGWRRILLDDLAHEIITELDRPVLVVR
jgi:nucleotide-binding universal stress UspA family protein